MDIHKREKKMTMSRLFKQAGPNEKCENPEILFKNICNKKNIFSMVTETSNKQQLISDPDHLLYVHVSFELAQKPPLRQFRATL